jgi:hypothetical protein
LKLDRRLAGLLAGLCCLVLAPAALAAGPADVTVRIEGAASTLREQAPVRTTLDPVNKSGNPGEDCTGTSAAGALEKATAGDWDGGYSSFGYSVDRIFRETYTFGNQNGDFWSFWVNHKLSSTGVCGYELQQGDDVLFFVDRCTGAVAPDYTCKNDPVLPLELRTPASAQQGAPAEVTVVRYDAGGNAAPVRDAQVSGPGVQATTGDGGKATVTFPQAGQISLKASKAGFVRSAAEAVAVSAPGRPAPAPAAAADTIAPLGRIAGIREGRRFKRTRAPRTLHGTVAPDPSGLRAVKLSLTRSAGGRCQLYSPSRERFRNSRCGRRVNFSIGDRADWSYLLPRRLGKGRYVLDVIAVDKAGNRDRLARGRSRVVFFVR